MKNHRCATGILAALLLLGCMQHKNREVKTIKNRQSQFFKNAGIMNELQAEADSLEKIIFQRKKF